MPTWATMDGTWVVGTTVDQQVQGPFYGMHIKCAWAGCGLVMWQKPIWARLRDTGQCKPAQLVHA